MIAPHAIQRHPSNAQPRLRVLHSGCRRACWAMMMRQARRSSAIQHYTVRCGFLSQRSYVAPSRQRRSSSKRPRKELTYCPIYGFKSFLICAKELTPALFCPRDAIATGPGHSGAGGFAAAQPGGPQGQEGGGDQGRGEPLPVDTGPGQGRVDLQRYPAGLPDPGRWPCGVREPQGRCLGHLGPVRGQRPAPSASSMRGC